MSAIAKVLDKTVRAVGPQARTLARKLTPMPIKRKLSALLASTADDQGSVLTAATGARFVSIQEPVFLQLRYEGIYERSLTRIIRSLVSPGDISVDVGANFGWHTVSMAECVAKEGQVFAFEPNSEMFGVLEQNIALNDLESQTTAINAAVGEVEASGQLHAADGQSAIGYVSLDDSNGAGGPGESVKIVPIDDVLADHLSNISFIKIDAEGFEPFVLRGMRGVIASENPPAIMVEFSPEALERQPHGTAGLLAQLREVDAVMTIEQDGRLVETNAPPTTVVTNLFLLPTRGKFQVTVAAANLKIESTQFPS